MVRIAGLTLLVAFSLIIFACGKKGPPTLKDYQVGLNFAQMRVLLYREPFKDRAVTLKGYEASIVRRLTVTVKDTNNVIRISAGKRAS